MTLHNPVPLVEFTEYWERNNKINVGLHTPPYPMHARSNGKVRMHARTHVMFFVGTVDGVVFAFRGTRARLASSVLMSTLMTR